MLYGAYDRFFAGLIRQCLAMDQANILSVFVRNDFVRRDVHFVGARGFWPGGI